MVIVKPYNKFNLRTGLILRTEKLDSWSREYGSGLLCKLNMFCLIYFEMYITKLCILSHLTNYLAVLIALTGYKQTESCSCITLTIRHIAIGLGVKGGNSMAVPSPPQRNYISGQKMSFSWQKML